MKVKQYRWICSWSNGKGCFHPDYEGCNCMGRPTKDKEKAIEDGKSHVEKHPWGRWGYPPLDHDWRAKFIRIEEIK